MSGYAARGTTSLMRSRPWSARFAAAIVLLTCGTVGLTSLALGFRTALTSHALAELPAIVAIRIVILSSLGSLYSFLAMTGFLLLPPAIPLIGIFAALAARSRR